jgi:hypothetical protein
MAERERLDVAAFTYTVRYNPTPDTAPEDDLPWEVWFPDGSDYADAFETESEAREYAEGQTAEALDEERDRIETQYEADVEAEEQEERDELITLITDDLAELSLSELRSLYARVKPSRKIRPSHCV